MFFQLFLWCRVEHNTPQNVRYHVLSLIMTFNKTTGIIGVEIGNVCVAADVITIIKLIVIV